MTETQTAPSTRYVIRAEFQGRAYYIHALAPMTNPSWTDDLADAVTYASAAYARRQIRTYTLENAAVVEVLVRRRA